MQHLTEIVEALISRDEDPVHGRPRVARHQ
jgi:hypothetical protein